MTISTTLLLALLLSLGFVCQWLAWRTRLPAILYLLACGIALGPVSGILNPDALLGELLFPVISLGVAIILFEGSLGLRIAEIRHVRRIIRNLITLGVLLTWFGMALAARWLVEMPWSLALLFGAMVAVTGPTVIVPMLRSIQPTERIANILRWEGILVDPIGALLALLVFEAIISGQQTHSIQVFLASVGTGAISGVLGGMLLALVLHRHWVPEYLINFATLALVLLVFAASNAVVEESGLLAVTVMGMVLANQKDVTVEHIRDFKEHLSVLIISLLFLVLAARMDFGLISELGWASLGVLAIALFIVRPISIFLCRLGTSVTRSEALLLSWIAPRGIVAAAVSALFAIKLQALGYTQANALVALTFVLIIGTVLIQSITAKPLANWLELSAANAQGVLIVGINRVSLALADILQKLDIPVLLADNNWSSVQEGRMAGFRTYYGNPLSERAEVNLDLTGITRVFALSRNVDFNTLLCAHYRPQFGAKHLFTLDHGGDDEKHGLKAALRHKILFTGQPSWSKLASLLGQGWQWRRTKLSDNYNFADFQAANPEALLLLALDDKGVLRIFGEDPEELHPQAGWTVVGLVEDSTKDSEGDDTDPSRTAQSKEV